MNARIPQYRGIPGTRRERRAALPIGVRPKAAPGAVPPVLTQDAEARS